MELCATPAVVGRAVLGHNAVWCCQQTWFAGRFDAGGLVTDTVLLSASIANGEAVAAAETLHDLVDCGCS